MQVSYRMSHKGTRLSRSECHFVLLPFRLHGIVSCYRMASSKARNEVVVAVRAISKHLHVCHNCNKYNDYKIHQKLV